MIPIITAVAGVLSALSSLSNLSGTSAVAGSDPTQLNPSGASATTFSSALQSALNRDR
jgi:hypothetical protein